MLPIRDGRINFLGQTLEQVAGGLYARNAVRYGIDVPPLSRVASGAPLPARVNHNRWIVDCPDCGGAEFVWPDEPLMLCNNCWNATVGGAWRTVKLPSNRGQIERALRARPLPQSRNWEPGETLASLKADNLARGLPAEVT